MKIIPLFLLTLVCAASLHAAIPTPDSAMSFSINKDPRKWIHQFQDGNQNGFIMELVPEGDSIKAWKEMAAQQIVFTKASLRQFVDTWKGMLLKAEPKVEI